MGRMTSKRCGQRFRAVFSPVAGRVCALVLVAASVLLPTKARADGGIFTGFQEGQVLGTRLNGKLSKVGFTSPALGGSRRMYVYTPPGYNAAAARTYPVLVMLHGTPGDPVDWLYKGEAHTLLDKEITSKAFPACIAVFANGTGPFHKGGSEWADSRDGRCKMETALAVDLPRYLKEHYRVSSDPAQWTIGGLSAGGYGAANLAVRHPDVYRNVIVLSGDFVVKDDWGDATDIFGTDPAVRAANSPLQQIRTLPPDVRKKLHFYVAIGDDDDDAILGENEAFARTCRELGVPIRYDRDPGKHKWAFWSQHFDLALTPLARWLAGGQS